MAECRRLTVDEVIEILRQVKLPPHQLEALGLKADWNQHIDREFVAQVLDVIERYRDALDALAHM